MIIGIDPGLSGALAVLYLNTLTVVADLPIMAVGKGTGAVRNQINAAGFRALIMQLPVEEPCIVYIEKISAMPEQGIAGAFSIGDTVGCLRGVVAAMGLPIEWVTPQSWKKYFNLPRDKEAARAKAIQLYPGAPLELKKHHNRAEAILLARYGWEQQQRRTEAKPF